MRVHLRHRRLLPVFIVTNQPDYELRTCALKELRAKMERTERIFLSVTFQIPFLWRHISISFGNRLCFLFSLAVICVLPPANAINAVDRSSGYAIRISSTMIHIQISPLGQSLQLRLCFRYESEGTVFLPSLFSEFQMSIRGVHFTKFDWVILIFRILDWIWCVLPWNSLQQFVTPSFLSN